MLEKAVLFIVLIAAISYIAYTLFFSKSRDCGCGCDKPQDIADKEENKKNIEN